MNKLVDMIINHIHLQVENGSKSFQLFDSWAGALSSRDFKRYVLPTMEYIFTKLSTLDVPSILDLCQKSGQKKPRKIKQFGNTVVQMDSV